jgi:hypothetical protein
MQVGSTKDIKKEAILLTSDDFGRFSSFPENIFCLGSFVGELIYLIAPEMVPWL